MHGQPVGCLVYLPVLFQHTLQLPVPKAKYLDILDSIHAFQHKGFHLPKPCPVTHAHRPSRFHGKQGQQDADYHVHGQQRCRKQGIDIQRQPKGCARKDDYRKHRPDGVCKKILDCLNIRHSHVQDITLGPVHQAGGRQFSYGLKQMDPHGCQELICPCMGGHAFQITAGHYQDGTGRHQRPKQHRTSLWQPVCAGKDPKGAKSHKPHMGKIPHNTCNGCRCQRRFDRSRNL